MNLKTTILTLLTALTCANATAQNSSGAVWMSASVDKKLSRQLSVEVEGEYRTSQWLAATDRMSIGASATYRLAKGLKAAGGYEYLHGREQGGYTESGKYYNSSYWYPRHRVYAGLTGSKKWGRWQVSLRERWVYTYRPSFMRDRMDMRSDRSTYGQVIQTEKKGKAENVLRSKLQAEYNIQHCPVTPFASVELYNAWSVQKVRYSAGAEYKINKHNSMKLYYLFQDRRGNDQDSDSPDLHVIGVQYSHSL